MLFGMGFSLELPPLLGRAMGEGNDLKAAEIMKNGFSLSGICWSFSSCFPVAYMDHAIYGTTGTGG
jgi:Na+-driven multidrug efflux pump